MPCAYVQLAAIGVQDEKLTGNPQMTFFETAYDSYINFAMEEIENNFQGVVDFGRKVQLELQRNGDLVTDCTLELVLPELKDMTGTGAFGVAWAPNLGHTLVYRATINVGGCDLDRQYGIWWDAWNELTLPCSKRAGYNQMIGQQNLVYVAGLPNGGVESPHSGCTAVTLRVNGNQTCKNSGLDRAGEPLPEDSACCRRTHPEQRLYIPLYFWFNTNPGLALPLAALTFTQVRIQYEFRCFEECVVMCCPALADQVVADKASAIGTTTQGGIVPLHMVGASLWVNYIYLDNDARQALAQNPHEQLIVQHQYNQGESVVSNTPRINLNFNHPISELVMWFQEDAAVARSECQKLVDGGGSGPVPSGCGGAVWGGNQWNFYAIFDAAGGPVCDPCAKGENPVSSLKLRMNGQDRFHERTGDYFNLVQPFYHHSNIPYYSPDFLDTRSRGLMVYSFALSPEEYQPQGTANFSRLDTAVIAATMRNMGSGHNGICHVFARNYNFLRTAGGVIGAAFQS